MRRLTAWIGGVAGGIAAYRLWRRHSQPAPEPSPAEPDDRAEELRTKLAQSKATPASGAEPVVEGASPEPTVEEEPESPEDRRRRVHEEGRATLDDMKPD